MVRQVTVGENQARFSNRPIVISLFYCRMVELLRKIRVAISDASAARVSGARVTATDSGVRQMFVVSNERGVNTVW